MRTSQPTNSPATNLHYTLSHSVNLPQAVFLDTFGRILKLDPVSGQITNFLQGGRGADGNYLRIES